MSDPIIFVVGTRPDAIKLIPVYKLLKQLGKHVLLCATNQHRELLDQVFDLFEVRPDITLGVMKENQSLDYLTAAILTKITEVFIAYKPQLLVVQGDTTSKFAASLAAFYLNVPIAHVEAGLRTKNMRSPFPEEMNRSFISALSTLHFAPTPLNVFHLLEEGVPSNRVFCVGNTIVDTLVFIKKKMGSGAIATNPKIKEIVAKCKQSKKRIILLTAHRRESFDGGITQILQAIMYCSKKYPDLFFIFPVHPNPHVKNEVEKIGLSKLENVFCSAPLSYQDLVYSLSAAELVMTDSGGIQEEAVSMGKRVLILRECTERVELIWCGMGEIVGTCFTAIINAFDKWYTNVESASSCFIYGDGNASQRIVAVILQYLASLTHQNKHIQDTTMSYQVMRSIQ